MCAVTATITLLNFACMSSTVACVCSVTVSLHRESLHGACVYCVCACVRESVMAVDWLSWPCPGMSARTLRWLAVLPDPGWSGASTWRPSCERWPALPNALNVCGSRRLFIIRIIIARWIFNLFLCGLVCHNHQTFSYDTGYLVKLKMQRFIPKYLILCT